MARTIIFPAAIRYQGELASTCASLKAVGYSFDTETLDAITAFVKELQTSIATLERTMSTHDFASTLDHARHMREAVLPAMLAVRQVSDRLEGMVADDLWPLATYQEMLFIK
jgi:glutamine synthetase